MIIWLRIKPARPIQPNIHNKKTRTQKFLGKNCISMKYKSKSGILRTKFLSSIRIGSSLRKYPQSEPIKIPKKVSISATTVARSKERRVPSQTTVHKSLPARFCIVEPPVPNQLTEFQPRLVSNSTAGVAGDEYH